MKVVPFALLLLFVQKPAEWELVSDIGPEPRYINQLAAGAEGLLLFGGKNNESDGFDDLWQWAGDRWTYIGSGATPRWDHSYVYMNNQLFLFGGRSFNEKERVDLNDSWTYKKGEWSELAINSPEPRSSHSMAFNLENEEVILFGGRNKDMVFSDTWKFKGEQWIKPDVSGPSKRFGHTLTYDPFTKSIYLFGGHNGDELLNDFWSYDGEKWEQITPSILPSARMAHSMQFDSSGKAVLLGGWDGSGASDELWTWGKDEWTQVTLNSQPEARLSQAIGYDESTNSFILFGGSTGFSGRFLPETWKLTISKD